MRLELTTSSATISGFQLLENATRDYSDLTPILPRIPGICKPPTPDLNSLLSQACRTLGCLFGISFDPFFLRTPGYPLRAHSALDRRLFFV